MCFFVFTSLKSTKYANMMHIMPIPKPTTGENREAFMSRCLSSDIMQQEYTDNSQRVAICSTAFDDKDSKMNDETEIEQKSFEDILDLEAEYTLIEDTKAYGEDEDDDDKEKKKGCCISTTPKSLLVCLIWSKKIMMGYMSKVDWLWALRKAERSMS